jgi:hypothetical protein
VCSLHKKKKEHVVFLQDVWCLTVRGGLFREVAPMRELESLNTKRSVDCGDAGKLYHCTARTENICHVNKCILLCM